MADDKDKKRKSGNGGGSDDGGVSHRQIIPKVDDEDMFEWLCGLFNISPNDAAPGEVKSEPDAFPDAIELRPVFGRGGRDTKADPIFVKEWKAQQSPEPRTEQLVMLAAEMLRRAQNDCNGLKHPQRYGLFARSNLKGAGYYSRYLFALGPTARIYEDKDMPATDDEGTHRDQLLRDTLAHNRWLVEQQTEAMSGIMRLQQDIIRQQAETIARQDSERRAWILTSEEALSRKQEREIAAERAKVWNDVIAEGVDQLKSLLPAVKIYLTKGKGDTILDTLRKFVDSLAEEEFQALFGEKDANGQFVKKGILKDEQIMLFDGILTGTEPVAKLSDFMMSFETDQLIAAQNAIRPAKIQELAGIVKSAADVINKPNGAQA